MELSEQKQWAERELREERAETDRARREIEMAKQASALSRDMVDEYSAKLEVQAAELQEQASQIRELKAELDQAQERALIKVEP